MLFKNAYIFTEAGTFRHGSFRVEDGRFAEILSCVPEEAGVDLEGQYVIPGLVDLHIHGAAGADLSDGDDAGLAKMAGYLARNGVTSFAPASMTLPYEALERAFSVARRFAEHRPDGCARLMGIHMEGPFLSAKKKGAQNGAYLKEPDFPAFWKLYDGCGGLLRIVDIAPELPGAEAFIRQAAKLCVVSVAHTDADYGEAEAAFAAGATHLTHLYNVMPPIHHRSPGVIGAASERENVVAELICDGEHVHPSAVRMAFRLFPGRICLVSDALRCCGMPDGRYELGGQEIFLQNGAVRLSDGTLAGSAANLYDCMRRAVAFGIPREQAILSATRIPAEQLGRDGEIGSIAPGKLADFVVCAADLTRKAVCMGGSVLCEP
ncbi:MAG: N-acetylglucosamine-6-phosphate deacetylase [Ruminococcaceae bacterium]|nr:N-acetylglucosamine-6-phosphate deacetylase [Oscillospiraceae bacterium]